MKKLLIFATLIVLISVNLLSNSMGESNLSGKIIYVDDEGDGDYTCIQDAIDNATEGDIILVYSGIYTPIELRSYNLSQSIKGITLKGIPNELGEGNDTGKPVIIGRENHDDRLIYITDAEDCIVKGFELIHGDIGILLYDSWNNTISENLIFSCTVGIELNDFVITFPTYNNVVENNTIIDCYQGIEVENTFNNLIRGNWIQNCSEWGMFISGECNKIKNNYFYNNGHYTIWGDASGGGVTLAGDIQESLIERNHFEQNIFGIFIFSNFNYIRNNNFIKNKEDHACFMASIFNFWRGNYWDDWRGYGPEIILGYLFYYRIPLLNFDWFPAKELHDTFYPKLSN